MSSSLDKLVSNLPDEAFKYTSEEIKNDKKLNLLKRKGVYPYDYMDSFNGFDETKLPSKDKFYSTLNDENISDGQYKHAKKVWKAFKIKNLGEYYALINRARGPYEEIFVLTFKAYGPNAVRSMRLECHSKYFSYGPKARLTRAWFISFVTFIFSGAKG